MRPLIIAEVKTKSPFGFVSPKNWDELFVIADEVGDMISIHTDSRWGGSFELLKKDRAMTKKPILAKGLHENDEDAEEALKCGADFVLVVGRVPKIHQEKLIIEPLNIAELSCISQNLKALWNSRDLATGELKTETFSDARKIFRGWLCQASNIKTISDIQEDADAMLVESHLSEFAESLKNKGL